MSTSNTQNSPANYLPYLRYKSLATLTWETPGNSMTITDANVHTNSFILIVNTSITNGTWYISTIAEGTFTITSSDSEGTPTFKYMAF